MVTKIYSRNFSDICDLQRKETIDYNLLNSSKIVGEIYGIELVSSVLGNTYRESLSNLSASKDRVMDVIRYLYENSVKADNFKDIVRDIFQKMVV